VNWKDFEALASRARDDRPEAVDVRARVLAAVQQPRPAPDRALLFCAAGALAAAVVVLALAWPALESLDAPLAGVLPASLETLAR
jgi:hypothetical protein